MEDFIGLPVVIPNGGAWQFQGYDEYGLLRSLNGRVTGVHKVLRSAAEIALKGRQDFHLGHHGGYMIPIHSKIGQGIGRVEMAVREVKRQCRTLRISAEHNTGVRIADDSPLLSWLPRFAAQVVNNMRIGKDGKTSEMRRTSRRWRKPMAQFGDKVWFPEIGEDGVSFFCKSHD